MARKLRQNEPGGIYHVFARGNNRERIFVDDRDRTHYLTRYQQAARRLGWRSLSYCLMHNHVHLLVETPQPNLSAGMQFVQGAYAQIFNKRHGRVGHVFQGRYGAVMMRSDAQVCMAAAYIARNPVEAGLCRAPADWPWSSFSQATEVEHVGWLDQQRLLGFFGDSPDVALRRYIEMSLSTPYEPGR